MSAKPLTEFIDSNSYYSQLIDKFKVLDYIGLYQRDFTTMVKEALNSNPSHIFLVEQPNCFSVSELERDRTPTPTIEDSKINDIVEIINGSFRGSRTKISLISQVPEEITVDLFESSVCSVPIVLHADSIIPIQPSKERQDS